MGFCFDSSYTDIKQCIIVNIGMRIWLVGWLCLTSHRQQGNLETAPPFTVPCEYGLVFIRFIISCLSDSL